MSDTLNPQNQQVTISDNNLAQFVEIVEKELVDHIVSNLRHRELTPQQAQELARDFLAQLPAQDKQDLLDKLRNLGATYPAAKQVYVKVASPIEEEKRQKTLELMRDHIKNGDIEKAIAVAKGGKE